MTTLGPKARQFIGDRIDRHTDDIDSIVLQNRVFEADDGAPETLYHLATAAEAALYAEGSERRRDRDDLVRRGASDTFDAAHAALEAFVDELVARECAQVIAHADEWAATWDVDRDFDAAKREAREWLQQHTDAAARADVLDDLEVRA